MEISNALLYFNETLLIALGILVFWQFRTLVEEVKELRREIHQLNLKIADILANDKQTEIRLQLLEEQNKRR